MRFIISFTAITSLSFTFIIVLAALAAKKDYNNIFPFTNGFLNPSTDQLIINTNNFINLKLIALNKLFKIIFFTKLITNLTNKVRGYNLNYSHNYILQTLKAVIAVNP
jgi:hypothetical protein